MVRNIPTKFSEPDLKAVLEQCNLAGTFDFVSIPRTRRSNLGYAFVNFLTPEAADECRRKLNGTYLGGAAHKVCQVVAAHLQGCTHTMLKSNSNKKLTSPLPLMVSEDDGPKYVQTHLGQECVAIKAVDTEPWFVQPISDVSSFGPCFGNKSKETRGSCVAVPELPTAWKGSRSAETRGKVVGVAEVPSAWKGLGGTNKTQPNIYPSYESMAGPWKGCLPGFPPVQKNAMQCFLQASALQVAALALEPAVVTRLGSTRT